ncbi:P-type conjugative transfer protein VirB9 (plasmid) [Yersinia pseudotuberculosis IP 32953]|uniref:TriH protein n=1 Tax=Yersinia pseudotuberculosis serotype I (strain IP32953) TaxID=273123 RepID=Q663E1_YERPS|nr:P-type conjugative transfer protein VirB9 [Yersinia pseudotuberculosis]AJJ53079.1 P-type conjugative transfer protein VirB9 [Yersinia pseudotuberculosis IP 32953]CAF25455.1 TriH protein [Yersinia pseudotuberculosis IP 32953]CNM04264.1 TriH protein [Yersinia pseudotuberculosis]
MSTFNKWIHIFIGVVLCTFTFSCAIIIFSPHALAAATPQGSAFDSRMQHVSYNAQNATVINARAGYVTTLVFSDDEAVISTEVGFVQGWSITKEANRVYIRPAPITQPSIDDEGKEIQEVFNPTADDWKTNLFVTTTRHFYSLELSVLDGEEMPKNLAFVVTYRYPDEVKTKTEQAQTAREKEWQEQQSKARITQALKNGQAPRNWDYSMQVGKDSRMITPDFAYDDGRFTYLGFSPLKKFPTATLYINGVEQVPNTSVKPMGNYQVMVIQHINPTMVLRYGDAVVGVINQGFGKVTVAAGNTVSPAVERVEVKS